MTAARVRGMSPAILVQSGLLRVGAFALFAVLVFLGGCDATFMRAGLALLGGFHAAGGFLALLSRSGRLAGIRCIGA